MKTEKTKIEEEVCVKKYFLSASAGILAYVVYHVFCGKKREK